jgi:Helix-turn-helix domain
MPQTKSTKSSAPTNGELKRKESKARRTELLSASPAIGAFKLDEARGYLGGLSIPTMHRLIARGLLKPCRATRHLLFPKKELDRFLMT